MKLLTSQSRAKLDGVGWSERNVMLLYQQFEAAFRMRLSQDAQRFLAMPEPVGTDQIDYYTADHTRAQRYTDLPAKDRPAVDARIEAIVAEIEAFRRDLAASGDSNNRNIATALERTFLIPGKESIWLVDGAPVVTNWGFQSEGAALDVRSITGPKPKAQAAAAPTAPKRRSWWPLLLLLALLAALLAWLFWPQVLCLTGAGECPAQETQAQGDPPPEAAQADATPPPEVARCEPLTRNLPVRLLIGADFSFSMDQGALLPKVLTALDTIRRDLPPETDATVELMTGARVIDLRSEGAAFLADPGSRGRSNPDFPAYMDWLRQEIDRAGDDYALITVVTITDAQDDASGILPTFRAAFEGAKVPIEHTLITLTTPKNETLRAQYQDLVWPPDEPRNYRELLDPDAQARLPSEILQAARMTVREGCEQP